MDKTPLYHEIAESIRQAILYGTLQPGDELPPVRDMSERWGCAPGTVQRAYQELAQQGLVVGRPGQGTRVAASSLPDSHAPLRRATLVHEAESFLLGTLAAGYTPTEIEGALRLALDRWRAVSETPPEAPGATLRFVGSHDPSIALIAARFADLAPGHTLRITFAGSLGGLIALAEYEADLAGCHLWDAETDTYNVPFVRRFLPGRRVALLAVAQRRLGLIVPPGNPAGLADLADLARPGLRFINRQSGAGTRVWLDAQLHELGIDAGAIEGYERAVSTHSEVARAVAQRDADSGLGVETVALAYGLDFVPLTTERYDLVIPAPVWDSAPVQALVGWFESGEASTAIAALGGYDAGSTGQVRWIE